MDQGHLPGYLTEGPAIHFIPQHSTELFVEDVFNASIADLVVHAICFCQKPCLSSGDEECAFAFWRPRLN